MKKYILRVQGEMVDIEPMEKCERCSEVVDSEAAMLAIIKALRERIDKQDERIKELEKRKDTIPFVPIQDRYPNSGDGWRLDPPFVFTCRY